MSTLTAHLSRGATRLLVGTALATCVVATSLSLPDSVAARARGAATSAYGWPVKPFDRQHPVRGFFGDPRIGLNADGTTSRQFHFGVDVSAPNGTPVYATLTGRVSIHPEHGDVVFIDGSNGVEFSYWHVVPVGPLRRQRGCLQDRGRPRRVAVGARALLGDARRPLPQPTPARGDGPVRGSDPSRRRRSRARAHRRCRTRRAGRGRRHVRHHRRGVRRDAAAGRGAVAEHAGHACARSLAGGRLEGRRHELADRRRLPRDHSGRVRFGSVFARWTRQNHPNRPGRYRIYLAHAWNSAQLPAGNYRIEVSACDSRGNTDAVEFPLTLATAR